MSIWRRFFTTADPAPPATPPGLPSTMTREKLARLSKTDTVLVDPKVIARFLAWAAWHDRNEVGGFLLGRIDGRYLVIENVVLSETVGTAVNIEFNAADFEKAQAAAADGQLVVGWVHSHPTYTAFMSHTDARFQTQGQGLFADYVALVLDPFRPKGVEFAFYRMDGERALQLPHHYWRSGDAA